MERAKSRSVVPALVGHGLQVGHIPIASVGLEKAGTSLGRSRAPTTRISSSLVIQQVSSALTIVSSGFPVTLVL